MSRILKKSSDDPDKPRLLDKLNIIEGIPVELVVLEVKRSGIRCKHLASQLPVTYRKVRFEVEGEIITVMPSKVWQFKNTVYVSGDTIKSRIDASALNLTPLKLSEMGDYDPDEEDLICEDDPFAKYYLPILAYGPRKEFEMEQVLLFKDPDDVDSDPILQAVDARESGDIGAAHQILREILAEDLRCIDAHAHLGNLEFEVSESSIVFKENKAKRHYEVGIKIAELSFSSDFHDLLPWGYINNRPYLRCLHGYGLCLYREGNLEDAKTVFEKILWLNPDDNQGIRVLLASIDAGKRWCDLEKPEEDELYQ